MISKEDNRLLSDCYTVHNSIYRDIYFTCKKLNRITDKQRKILLKYKSNYSYDYDLEKENEYGLFETQ